MSNNSGSAPQHSSKSNASAYSAAKSAVERAVHRAHELGILYADEDWAPISDLTLALLLKRAGIRWEYTVLEGVCEIVSAPICGIHIMLVERAQTPGERRFAVRHGLGHVLAGHVEEASFVRDRDPLSHEERVADMFAFADLIPDRMLQEMRDSGYRPWDLELWTIEQMMRYCPTWRLPRLHDRLNMLLPIPSPADGV